MPEEQEADALRRDTSQDAETLGESTPEQYYDENASSESLRLDLTDTNAIDPPQYPEYDRESELEEGEEEKKGPAPKRRLRELMFQGLMLLRPYYILDNLNYKSFRIAFRSWVKLWVCLLLMFIGPTNRWIGSVSFLMSIYSLIVPCGTFSIIQSITFGIICLSGALLGWAAAIIASAICASINGHKTASDYAAILVQEGLCTPGPTITRCVQDYVFEGHFRQAKTSVIYIIAIIIVVTFNVFVKLKYRAFMFMGIVGNIAGLINLIYGSYIPYFNALTIGLIVLKPLGLTFAFNVVLAVILFPKTSNYAFFNSGMNQLKGLYNVSKTLLSIVRSERPSGEGFSKFKKIGQTILTLRARIPLMEMDREMIGSEISYGRFDKISAGKFNHLLSFVSGQLAGFEIFFQFIADCRKVILEEPIEHPEDPCRPYEHSIGAYEKRQRELFYDISQRKIKLEDLDTLMDLVALKLEKPTAVASEGLSVAIEWLDTANHFRAYSIFSKKKYQQKQAEMANRLREVYEKVVATTEELDTQEWKDDIIKTFNRVEFIPALVGQSLLFGFLVRQYLFSVRVLLEFFIAHDDQCPSPRIVTPRTRLVNVILNKDPPSTARPQPPCNVRDAEADPPRNIVQRIGRLVSRSYHLSQDKAFMIALRTGIFTALTAFPAFFRTTAGWYYGNRLVWLTIMCAMCTFQYLGDTLYAFLCDGSYTFTACVLGLVTWYIGSGSGPGNPYGMAAVTGVVSVFVIYYRHFSIHLIPLPAIIFCVTWVLVIGTSWEDTYLPQTRTLGTGFRPAWLRFVTVIIGLAVGVIASIFPRPYTSKKQARVWLAELLKATGRLHCDIGSFAIARARDPRVKILVDGNDPVLATLNKLQGLMGATRMRLRAVKFEPPLQGTFPRRKYFRLLRLQGEILLMYRFLYSMFNLLEDPTNVVPDLVERLGWTNNSLVSELLAVIQLCSLSLFTKAPLPMMTPAQTTFHHYFVHEMDTLLQQHKAAAHRTAEHEASTEEGDEKKPKKFQPMRWLAKGEIHIDNYDLTHDGRIVVGAECLVADIYAKIDELAMVVKELVGEQYNLDQYFLDHDRLVQGLV
ncbi:hypothetical protein TRVA0_002S02058 [Trichomonascus vanleenenianus]|uniref:uncharacterized protein n=1 Tax=Trichomonascus vanleenenianus TaxID=2268995 RepID=UPI003ECA7762